MKTKSIIFIVLIALISSCTHSVYKTVFRQYEPLDVRSDFLILGINEEQPEHAEQLGTIVVHAASIRCDLSSALIAATAESRKIGGNVLKITQYSVSREYCPIVTADILRIRNPLNYHPPTISEDANYALLHIYRPDGFEATLEYDLHLTNHDLGLRDSLIARSTNNWRETIRIEDGGIYTLRAERVNISLNIAPGNEYYVRSSVLPRLFFRDRPLLKFEDEIIGRVEFQTVGGTTDRVRDYKLLQLTANGGFGFRPMFFPKNLPSPEKDFLQKSNFGLQYHLGMTYFLSKQRGIGVRYNDFFSNSEITIDHFVNNVFFRQTTIRTNIQTKYIGAAVYHKFLNDKDNSFWVDFGLGYIEHKKQRRGDLLHFYYNFTLNRTALGFCINFGYDIKWARTTAVGFQLTFLGGAIGINETIVGEPTMPIYHRQSKSLSRIDLSVGLRY